MPSVSGSDITVWDNSDNNTTVTASITDGYYKNKSITFTDSDLFAGNILNGINIFGVVGTATAAYSPCTDDALNAGQCSTVANRYVYTAANGGRSANCAAGLNGSACWTNSTSQYVTGTLGANITSWTNASSTTTVDGAISLGYYPGNTIAFTDGALIASNIKSGVSIFNVAGSYTGSGVTLMSNMHRHKATAQITQETEAITNTGSAYPNDNPGYTSWGTSGILTTDIYSNSVDTSTDMLMLSDDSFIVAGHAYASSVRYVTMAKYTSSGTLDASFGSSGIAKTAANPNAYVVSIGTTPSGKILAAGSFVRPSRDYCSVYRYTSAGVLDTTFSIDGGTDTTFSSSSDCNPIGVTALSDESIVVGTRIYSTYLSGGLVKFKNDSTLDTTFNSSGRIQYQIPSGSIDFMKAMIQQIDGKIIAVGALSSGANATAFGIARYSSSGTLDLTFNSTGIVTTEIHSQYLDEARAVDIDSSGNIVVAGVTDSDSSRSNIVLVRYSSSGSLDLSFGTNGIVTTNINSTSEDNVAAVKIVSDGKILVGGSSWLSTTVSNEVYLVRFLSDGTLDTSFGSNGKLILNLGISGNKVISSMQVDSAGNIFLGGYYENPNQDFLIIKLLPNGSLDTSCNSTGYHVLSFSVSGVEHLNSIRLQADGSLFAVGNLNNSIAIAHLTSSGILDNAFATGGKATAQIATSDMGLDLSLKSDGSLLILGKSTVASDQQFSIYHFSASGVLDTSLGVNGRKILFTGRHADQPTAILPVANGKYLIGGSAQFYDYEDYDFTLLMVDENGNQN